MTITATRRPSSKKKSSTKGTTAKKGSKGSTAKKGSKGVAKKASKQPGKKGRSATASKAVEDARKASPSMPKGMPDLPHEINGVRVVTADGRKPGAKMAATGFVQGSRIKTLKAIQELRSGGVVDIDELVKSVRADGLIEPLVVRPAGDGSNFELIAGERRLSALKKIGGKAWEHVPVIIRPDLQGDDNRAIAVAVAENSPDGRTNLNIVDIGRQATTFVKKHGWSPERIAREFGLHVKTVRRSLQVMDTSPVIQSKVQAGELSMSAALEIHQLPAKMQKELEAKVGPETTAPEIRRERKRIEAAEAKEKASKGEKVLTKKGDEKVKLATSWRSPSDKKAQLADLCKTFHAADADDRGTGEWHEMRGMIAYALWDRGDLESPLVPSAFEEEMTDPSAEKKVNALLDTIIGNEAARAEARTEAPKKRARKS